MVGYGALTSLWDLAYRLEIEGALVECGTWNGGSASVIQAAAPSRPLWLFDSWEGLPEPGEDDVTNDGLRREAGWNLASVDTVQRRLPRANTVKGWFEDTIPAAKANIGPIALLHVDCDWYKSVSLVLKELYPQVAAGGVVAIDDYAHWRGCRKAVDEFFGDVTSLPDFRRVGQTIRFRKSRD
jgi:hypothetical protein